MDGQGFVFLLACRWYCLSFHTDLGGGSGWGAMSAAIDENQTHALPVVFQQEFSLLFLPVVFASSEIERLRIELGLRHSLLPFRCVFLGMVLPQC